MVKDHSDSEREREKCYFTDKEGKEGRKEMFYLTMRSTHFLWLYGVVHMVEDYSDSERGNSLPPHGRQLLSINSKGSFICTIPQTG